MKGLLFLIFIAISPLVERVICRDCFVDIGIVLDRSAIITGSNWREMLDFVSALAREIDYGMNRSRIGIISAGRQAAVNVKLNSYQTRSSFGIHLSRIRHSNNGVNRAAALQKLRSVLFNETNGDRVEIPNIAIFLMNGPPDRDKKRAISEANLLKESGVKIFVVGVGRVYDESEANAIASKPVFDYVQSAKFNHMKDVVRRLAHPVCENGKEKLLYFCSFEDDDTQCNMVHDIFSEYVWLRRKGPSKEYKLAPSSGANSTYYMHAESRIYIPGDKATIFIPFRIIGAKYCMKFSYNINGRNIAALQMLTMRRSDVVRVSWSTDSSTGKDWRQKQVTFHLEPGQQIAFRAQRLSNSPVSPALDRIQILLGACT